MEPSPSKDVGNDSQDDDDNWSRQVEADESVVHAAGLTSPVPPTPSSTRAVHDLDIDDEPATPGLAPERSEPTLKEKLVERERQRRVETERARLKHHFVLSRNTDNADEDNEEEKENGINNEDVSAVGVRENAQGNLGGGVGASRENGSNHGTAGDGSSVAVQDEKDQEGNEQKLTYPMERFLKEQGAADSHGPAKETEPEPLEQKVVMERFLHDHEPATIQGTGRGDRPAVVDRSVSFDVGPITADEPRTGQHRSDNGAGGPGSGDPSSRNRSYFSSVSTDLLGSAASVEANASVDANVSVEDDRLELNVDNDALPIDPSIQVSPNVRPESPSSIGQSPVSEQPLMLRLTEAEIQQMAAIDEASRSNAPPSERDSISESSFVGELTGDFGVSAVDPAGNLSQGTPVTALDSSSVLTGNQSGQPSTGMSADAQSLSGVSQQSGLSRGGADISVTANPPSVASAQDSPVPEEVGPVAESPIPNEIHSLRPSIAPDDENVALPTQMANHEAPVELVVGAAANEGIVNRRIRPGMVNTGSRQGVVRDPGANASATRAADFTVDDFDFNKHDPMSPGGEMSDSFRDLPPDNPWSSAGNMAVSPLNVYKKQPSATTMMVSNRTTRSAQDYGATIESGLNNPAHPISELNQNNVTEVPTIARGDDNIDHETDALLGVPSEIVAKRRRESRISIHTLDRASINFTIDDIFSDVRSQSTATLNAGAEEANNYSKTGILQRAFPERMIALTVTMIIEIPVLLMVSGGSDRLCMLIGRSKYQILMGFLPLSSAISGNVGLQASTLTTRAISHGHVTRELYRIWLMREIGAGVCLGVGMGLLIGLIAFAVSGYDLAFGLTVSLAQFVSIVTAGVTGTFAPLVFTFIFERDAGKWGGPLETAIQDIIGSFAMVVMSYKLLELFGPHTIEPDDMCG